MPESEVDQITQQASSLDISSKQQVKGQRKAGQAPSPPPQVSAIPSHVKDDGGECGEGGEGGGGVRRSPRIAKRARSLVDEVIYTRRWPDDF